jgi:hypothetical protein
MTNLQTVLSLKLTDALAGPLGAGTRRDTRLPPHHGKAAVVIGVRRAGKTTWLRQELQARLEAGRPRVGLVMIGLEDDRLTGMTTTDLDWLLEELFRRHPALRATGEVTLCLDEIQVVPEWERFVRRVLDTERIELLLSGSSAKLLSREVATSLRGRGVEVLMHPFSFREALRHHLEEPTGTWQQQNAAGRSQLDHRLRSYLERGGFAEAQSLDTLDRVQLLRGYVDVVVLRDVIERHAVSNPTALRWLQRELLGTPAGLFSINKLFQVMKSQGIAVGKDTLHDYLDHLEDSFLVRTVWMHSTSERQRMVNPRKVYPIDPGLIAIFERAGRPQTGHALETVVMLELERRGYDVSYVRTAEGHEVDFFATHPALEPLLVQVAAQTGAAATLDREVRSLYEASAAHPEATALLLTMDAPAPLADLPAGVRWMPATSWLLGEVGTS